MPDNTPLKRVSVDLETTGLDDSVHQITEWAWIVHQPDGSELERVFVPEHTLDGADPESLALTRYFERIDPRPRTPRAEVARLFAADTAGALLVGAAVSFDAGFIKPVLRAAGLQPEWDHRLQDVEALCAPYTTTRAQRFAGLRRCAETLGVPFDTGAHHGALYDARIAYDVYEAVWDRIEADRAAQAA